MLVVTVFVTGYRGGSQVILIAIVVRLRCVRLCELKIEKIRKYRSIGRKRNQKNVGSRRGSYCGRDENSNCLLLLSSQHIIGLAVVQSDLPWIVGRTSAADECVVVLFLLARV